MSKPQTDAIRIRTTQTNEMEHSSPLYLTSSFCFDDAESMRAAFADETGTMMIPFMDRMGWVFIFCIVSMVVITLSDPESKNNPQGLEIDAKMFKLSPTFIFGTVVICLFLTLVYTYFW